ncbi:MAG: DHH family phosphoesterase, partial [Clostridiales bacterium]
MSINIGDLQNNIYHELLDILQKENNLLITGHIDPDGDCIGSMLAIYHGFNGQAKGWQMVIECPVPEHLLFYPGAEMIKTVGEVEKELSSFSSALLLDCNQVFRAGSWLGKLWDDFSNRLIIDHHQGVGDDADLSLIEKDAAATGLIIAVLLQKAGLNIDQDIATCLYGSIAADT